MIKRASTQRIAALGAALGLSAAPAFAGGSLTPGYVWIGQAAGAGGNGAGNAGAAGAGNSTSGNGVGGNTGVGTGGVGGPAGAAGAGDAAGTAGGMGAGTNAAGQNGTNGLGSTNTGDANTNSGVGNTNSNSGTQTNANGTNANGTGTNGGNGTGTNGVGSSGNNGNGGVGSAQSNSNSGSAAGNGGAQNSLPIPGTSRAPQTFDLAQTIQAGLRSSADVQTATRNVKIDRARADQAAAAARPHVNATGQATLFDQKTVIPFGQTSIQVTGTHVEILQLNVTDQLDLTGQIRAATNQARLQSLADQFILSAVENARILRAQTIYFNTLRAQHQVDVAAAALTNAERQLTDATNLNNAGVGQRIDVLRAQTQVATAQQDLATAQNNFSVALTSFNDLVGRPLDASVALVDPPGVIIAQPVTDFTRVGAPDAKAALPLPGAPQEVAAINISQALRAANAQRPEILQAQVNVRVSQTGITLARSGLQPTFSLSAAGDYYPDTNFQFPRKRTAQISADLTIPLYDGGATRDRVQEARLSTENAQTSLGSTQSDVALDVRQAYLNLVTAAQQIGAANAALQSAVGARQLAQLRYEGQVGTYLEITDSQAALVQAENNQVNAVYNYLVSRAQFQNAIGSPQVQ